MYLNIESLLAHKTELEWSINQLKPIIVCLTETHITEEIEVSEINIKGYSHVSTNSSSRHTGGTLIYIKEEYRFKNILSDSLCMNMWITGIDITINHKRYIILNCYHSPNASHSEFMTKLENIVAEWTTVNCVLIVIGDFNINMARKTWYSEKLNMLIKNCGLVQIMDKFTRITNESSTIIDLIITNNKQLEFEVHTTPKITDHSIITINLTTEKNKPITYKKKMRNYNSINEIQFQLDLKDEEWLPDCTDTNKIADKLTHTIINMLNKHAPEKEISISNSHGNKNWFNTEIKQKIKDRDTQYKRAIITGEDSEWTDFKNKRNEVVKLIREQKQKYYAEKIEDKKHDPTELWKTLKTLVKGNVKNKKTGIMFNNEICEKDKEIAEKFNNYFLHSIEDITLSLNKSNNCDYILENMNKPSSQLSNFKKLNFNELKTIVRNLNNKKSSVDGINNKILKLSFEGIGDRFLQVINTSMEKGVFPKSWKTSTVVPIEKKPNSILCEEHRPINMVPCYEKLLELAVNEQIVEYVESNSILSKYQSGFRKNNSCESALQSILFNWKNALNNKKIIGAVFLDFQRAFETIDRKLLLLKLEYMGITNCTMEWFKSYLQDRYQVTKFGEEVSSNKKTKYGVPQGTVLGPNLFILYINDIVKYVNKCNIQMFADDTLIYIVGDDVNDIMSILNEELNVLNKWLTDNNLRLNINKTKYMIIKSKHNPLDVNNNVVLSINGSDIEKVSEIKYLGVIIDQNLTFSRHAEFIRNKVAKKINFLGRIGKNLNQYAKRTVYNSIIHSHFHYCSTILFLFNESEFSVLQKKQNLALRIILHCNRYTNIKQMLDNVEVLSVKQTVILNTMTFIYKMLNGFLPEHLLEHCVFVRDIHHHDTRNQNNFYIAMVRTNYGQKDLFHNGLKMYNDLPDSVKDSASIMSFRKNCKIHVRNNTEI